MEYISKGERELARWMFLGEVEAFVIGRFPSCGSECARQQIRAALGDGMFSLRWDVRPEVPTGRAGGATVEERLPPRRHKRWQDARINWDSGEVLDDFYLTAEAIADGHAKWRRLLIHCISVRAVWSPLADKYQDPDLYEEQAALRLRIAREEREAKQAAMEAVWAAECRKPMRQRQFFGADEIADALARKPGRLEIDAAEGARIMRDISDWTSRGEFDLSGDSEVVTLISEPPYFAPLAPARPGEIIVYPGGLFLRRHACRRYLLSSPLEGVSRLLRDWFPEVVAPSPSASSEPVPLGVGEPQPPTGLEKGQTPTRAGTPRQKAPNADVRKWYEGTYIPGCQTAGKRPSEAVDWAQAKLKFGHKVRRDQIRDLRRDLAPGDWRVQGRRPSSKNSAENSAK